MPNTKPVMGVIAVFSILFNGTLCIVILRKREMLRKSYHLLIFVLAITDTLAGIFMILSPTLVMDPNVYPVPSGIAGHLFCHLVDSGYIVFICGKFSIGLVTCMAIERWFAIARPTRYRALFTRRRVVYYMLGLLIWYLLWSIHSVMENQMTTIDSKTTCKIKELVTNKYLTRVWVVFYSSVTVVLPLLFVCGTFIHLRFVVRKHLSTTARPNIRHQATIEMKLTRMSVAVATMLAICFLPIQTFYILRKFGFFGFASREFFSTVILSMMNSWVNPWLYCLTNRTYKKEFIRLLCPCRNSPQSLPRQPKEEFNCTAITTVFYKEATDITQTET